jgi:hypothetical protein
MSERIKLMRKTQEAAYEAAQPEVLPASYVISFEEFIVPFEGVMQQASALGHVTRNNFTSTIITSFVLSKGNLQNQCAAFEWLRVFEGFDYRQTFRNYAEAGGHKCLSNEERNAVVSTYRKVNRHSDEGIEDFVPSNDVELLDQVDFTLWQLSDEKLKDEVRMDLLGLSKRELLQRLMSRY